MNSDLQIHPQRRAVETHPKAPAPPTMGVAAGATAPQSQTEIKGTNQISHSDLQRRIQDNIKATVERLNEQMRQSSRGLNFSVDAQSNKTIIIVRNTVTGEVVRQIPDEHLLKAAHSMEALRGLLHDGKY